MQVSRAYARKTGVGQERDLLAPGQMFQGQSELSHLFHSGAHRPTATQDDYVAGLDRPVAQAFERLHGFLFRMEYTGSGPSFGKLHPRPRPKGRSRCFSQPSLSGAKFPRGKQTVLVKPFSFAVDKSMMTSSGFTSSCSASISRKRLCGGTNLPNPRGSCPRDFPCKSWHRGQASRDPVI